MASLISRSNGIREIRFMDGAQRHTIRLGSIPKQSANGVLIHVQRLIATRHSNGVLADETARWLAKVTPEFHAKLERVGLVEPRRRADERVSLTLSELIDGYISRRSDFKPNTMRNFQQVRRNILRLIGDVPIESITPAHADDFRRALGMEYSEAHASKTTKCARQIFRDAVRRRTITENPFADVRIGSQRNPDRQRFIDAEIIERVIESAPDDEWKLLIALSRYGGLRVPSEPLALAWQDVDWERKRITIRSCKTEHHTGKGTRVVPMFPEIETHLRNVYDAAPVGSTHVITRYRSSTQNLRTQFTRIITRAGIAPWPKLWHNLRASRQTELARDYPMHVVCQWIGNSKDVAMDHYLQTTDADYERATAKPIDNAHHLAHQHTPETVSVGVKPMSDGGALPPLFPSVSLVSHCVQTSYVPPRGVEPLLIG